MQNVSKQIIPHRLDQLFRPLRVKKLKEIAEYRPHRSDTCHQNRNQPQMPSDSINSAGSLHKGGQPGRDGGASRVDHGVHCKADDLRICQIKQGYHTGAENRGGKPSL